MTSVKSPVHILVTVRKPELLPAAKLVFATLRVGFPSVPVQVWGNGLTAGAEAALRPLFVAARCQYTNLARTSHDAWVEKLVMNQVRPFWICDTDVVFFGEVEWFFDQDDADLFAGRYEPAWFEPWTRTRYQERLHTCVQWHNPAAERAAMMRWNRQVVPGVFATAQVPFIRQHFIPHREGTMLYDTTAGLWHAGWGTPFTDRQNESFEHLHAATYADEVGKCAALKDLPRMHAAVFADPQLARGIHKQQAEFYAQRALNQ